MTECGKTCTLQQAMDNRSPVFRRLLLLFTNHGLLLHRIFATAHTFPSPMILASFPQDADLSARSLLHGGSDACSIPLVASPRHIPGLSAQFGSSPALCWLSSPRTGMVAHRTTTSASCPTAAP